MEEDTQLKDDLKGTALICWFIHAMMKNTMLMKIKSLFDCQAKLRYHDKWCRLITGRKKVIRGHWFETRTLLRT